MPSQRSGPPIILSVALAATTGLVAIVGVMAGSTGSDDTAGLVIQVPVSRVTPSGVALSPAAGGFPPAGPAAPAPETTVLGPPDTTAPTVATVTTAPAVATETPVVVTGATQSTIVLEATPTAPAPVAERTGERVVQLDTGVSDATTRAS